MHTQPTPEETKELDLKIEIPEEKINTAIEGIAQTLNTNYKEISNIILMCMLNGAKPFYEKLTQHLNFPYTRDQMKISCYGDSTESSEATLTTTPQTSISDSNTVIIIDELIDKGNTLKAAKKYLRNFTRKLTTVVLFNREIERNFNADISGINITFPLERFLIGIGLDFKGKFRNFTNLYSMKKPLQATLSTELQPQISDNNQQPEDKALAPEETKNLTFN